MNTLAPEPIRTPTGAQFPPDIKLLGTPGLKSVKLKQREYEPGRHGSSVGGIWSLYLQDEDRT